MAIDSITSDHSSVEGMSYSGDCLWCPVRPHGLADLLDFAHAGLKDLVIEIVGDVVQLIVLRSHDARVLEVQILFGEAVVRHDWRPLVTAQCAYDGIVGGC